MTGVTLSGRLCLVSVGQQREGYCCRPTIVATRMPIAAPATRDRSDNPTEVMPYSRSRC